MHTEALKLSLIEKIMKIENLSNLKKIEDTIEDFSIRSEEEDKTPYNPKDKLALLDQICGAWEDTDENLAEEIKASRTISDKNLPLD